MNDGTGKKAEYTNPVLYSDYSAPDVIRVGEDYWMTASSFTSYPGLQLLHSADLVNREIVNTAIPRLEPAEDFDKPSHGNGIFQVHAEDPRGEWSAPHLIMAAKGIIDTCPLWDDDGKTYLVHGWAGSRAGVKTGWQLVLRSKSPYGPYEWRNVMHEGTSGIHGPHQGSWAKSSRQAPENGSVPNSGFSPPLKS